MRKRIVLLVSPCIVLCLSGSIVVAQRGDVDGDGIGDELDNWIMWQGCDFAAAVGKLAKMQF